MASKQHISRSTLTLAAPANQLTLFRSFVLENIDSHLRNLLVLDRNSEVNGIIS